MRTSALLCVCIVLASSSACCHERKQSEDRMILLSEAYTRGEIDRETEIGIKTAIRTYLSGSKPTDIEKYCTENKVSGNSLDGSMVWDEFLRYWQFDNGWRVEFEGTTREAPRKFRFSVWRDPQSYNRPLVWLNFDLEGINGKYKIRRAFLTYPPSTMSYIDWRNYDSEGHRLPSKNSSEDME